VGDGVRAQQLIRAVVVLGIVTAARQARAEPYLMVREGAKCSDCHTNQTGGGKRTPFAHIHAHDILHDLDLLPIPPAVKAFNGEINQYLSIGSDLRVRNTTVFADTPNSAGRVPTNRAFRDNVQSNDISVNQFVLYGQADLFPDILTLYADEDFTSGATNREAFGMLHGILPWGTYIKAGRMFPAYGLRIQDDAAFIRSNVGFTFQNPDAGIEFGTQPGPFFVATSITNGAGGDKDVQATINAYTLLQDVPVVRNVLFGGSFARQSNKRDVGGVYFGSNWWKFTYLGEFDWIDDRSPSSATFNDDFASYAELNLLLFDWLNVFGTFEFLGVSGDRNQTRYTIGANPFINRFIQPIIEYRINNAPPTNLQGNMPELWVELHLFL
jgi:hypothetical protein